MDDKILEKLTPNRLREVHFDCTPIFMRKLGISYANICLLLSLGTS